MRVTSDVHLVGSLPAATAEEAFRLAVKLFGGRRATLPDGETGLRARWVGYDMAKLASPAIEQLPGPAAPRGGERHRPLAGLAAPGARLILGLGLPADGAAGLRLRAATAARYAANFGVAYFCDFGRER